MTRLLTSSAGPWSPMPMHEVVPTLTNPSSGNLAGFDPETAAHALHQCRAALHALDDVVGEEHAIAARGRV